MFDIQLCGYLVSAHCGKWVLQISQVSLTGVLLNLCLSVKSARFGCSGVVGVHEYKHFY